MKSIISFAFLFVCLCSCNNNGSINTSKGKNQNSDVNTLKNKVYIRNKSLYDTSFINGLSGYIEPVSIIDDYIVTGNDTTYFPNDIPLNKHLLLKGLKGENAFTLNIARTNFTNLEYAFQVISKDGKIVLNRNGKSVLASTFFLASEMDEDIELDDTYGSYEYWDYSDSCTLSIRFGIGKDEKGRNRATITCGCKDKTIGNLNLDDCPILRTE